MPLLDLPKALVEVVVLVAVVLVKEVALVEVVLVLVKGVALVEQ